MFLRLFGWFHYCSVYIVLFFSSDLAFILWFQCHLGAFVPPVLAYLLRFRALMKLY